MLQIKTSQWKAALGAVWPNARKQEAGLAEDGGCVRCGAEVEDLFHCPCNATDLPASVRALSDRLVGQAAEDREQFEAFYTRGIVPRGWSAGLFDCETPEAIQQYGSQASLDSNTRFYLDGSGGTRTRDPRSRRCGWAAAAIDFNGPQPCLAAALWGPLPGSQGAQKVPRAELHAAVTLL